MTPALLDHAFVLIVLGLVFPFGGWWAYRRFLGRVEREGGAALVREYRITLVWLLGVGLGAGAVWLAGGRALTGLGFAPSRGEGDATLAIAIGAGAGLLTRPILAAVSPKVAASMRKQFASLEPFLPKTKEQLAWGLVVSVFAGVFEEIAYRGYLMAYFQSWFSDWGALAASSILFGFAHFYQGRLGTLVTTLLGGALGWLYLETGSLLLPMILHAAVDISAMLTAYVVLKASRSAPARS